MHSSVAVHRDQYHAVQISPRRGALCGFRVPTYTPVAGQLDALVHFSLPFVHGGVDLKRSHINCETTRQTSIRVRFGVRCICILRGPLLTALLRGYVLGSVAYGYRLAGWWVINFSFTAACDMQSVSRDLSSVVCDVVDC